jgi:hypothetical protein
MKLTIGLAFAALLFSTIGCTDHRHYYFSGRVYDGVTGQRLTDYKMQLQYLDRRIDGQVDSDGRYFVGPLDAFDDYTVAITAANYRSFLSHNMMRTDGDPKVDESFYFDAYLFPTDLTAPGATFTVTLSDSAMPPSGSVRMRPTSGPSLLSTPAAEPAGVASQVWGNNDDLQFRTVQKDFENGTISFMDGDLVYGVTYEVTVYNVKGHQDLVASFTAGVDANQTFTMLPYTVAPLKIAFKSTDLGVPIANGQLVIVFNEPIALDPQEMPETYRLAVDKAFDIVAQNTNMNGTIDKLQPPGMRGIKLDVSGNNMTLSWDPNTALQVQDVGDTILDVIYAGLSSVFVRPVGGDASSSTSVGALVGKDSVTVQVTAP